MRYGFGTAGAGAAFAAAAFDEFDFAGEGFEAAIFAGGGMGDVAAAGEAAIVEARAIPRKCFRVEGRGRAIGRRKERDIVAMTGDW